MKNIKMIVEYDGSGFYGWQKQEGLRTVESELEKALKKATNEDVKLIASGRTDKGVHARGQVINFFTNADSIPGENYRLLMDFLLPGDISIRDSMEVDKNFHARFDAKRRRYIFLVYNRESPSAIYRKFSYHYPYKVDMIKMKKASRVLIGSHDFTSFKATSEDKVNPVRTINLIEINRNGEFIKFIIEGNAFLYNMVRIIVGTLLYIGSGKIEVGDIKVILEARNREKAGITAGAQGLFLDKVFYD